MKTIEKILNFLAPDDCMVCGAEGYPICEVCMTEACPSVPSRCYLCRQMTTDSATCSKCHKKSALKNVWVRTEYAKTAKDLVYKMKFQSSRSVCRSLAEAMNDYLPFLPRDCVVVPVPTASSRKRQRSFDHAELIARELAVKQGLVYSPALVRLGQTRQVGSKRKQRISQLEESYHVKKDLLAKSVLLVDDIVTTGATLESAAKTLKKAGVKNVYAAVFAQKS